MIISKLTINPIYSRARVLQGVHAGFPRRPKASDSLFVMANHGQLLEYSLDPVPDQSKLMIMMEIMVMIATMTMFLKKMMEMAMVMTAIHTGQLI